MADSAPTPVLKTRQVLQIPATRDVVALWNDEFNEFRKHRLGRTTKAQFEIALLESWKRQKRPPGPAAYQ